MGTAREEGPPRGARVDVGVREPERERVGEWEVGREDSRRGVGPRWEEEARGMASEMERWLLWSEPREGGPEVVGDSGMLTERLRECACGKRKLAGCLSDSSAPAG